MVRIAKHYQVADYLGKYFLVVVIVEYFLVIEILGASNVSGINCRILPSDGDCWVSTISSENCGVLPSGNDCQDDIISGENHRVLANNVAL